MATLDELRQPAENQSPNVRSIVGRIRPAVEPVLAASADSAPDELLSRAVRANVRASVIGLQKGSAILEELIARRQLLVVGAEYSLETGTVDFFASE
jgi:carbonic anhydrase